MEPLELLEIIKLGEDSLHQFKKTIDRAASLAAEMAAFSNSSGGMIIVGVNDDSTIIGLTKEEIRKINNFISDASLNLIKNPINPLTENININDKILIKTGF